AVEGVASVDVPAGGAELRVVERLAGGAATDFGAPEAIPAADRRALAPAELEQLLAIHAACWSTLLDVARRASGRPLTSGPRGGGRSLPAILEHAAGAETAYLSQLGGRDAGAAGGALALRDSFAASARARAAGELPDRGPRGGQRWPARYAIRRSAWHLLDHAWEIEDRAGLGAPDG
ncbi:MAG TPA: hypothetical protein VNW68_01865, partial [Candidatus Limnocylindria bacterium]|nr:hypothetical protein [Candidatus Limnocylindria bacterium]